MPTCASNHEVPPGKNFCGTCGGGVQDSGPSQVSVTNELCPSGHPNRTGAKFCRLCGAAMNTFIVPAAAPVSAAPLPPPPLQAPAMAASGVAEFRAYESEILPPEDQPTRNLVVILIDNSGSMGEDGFSPFRSRLTELNEALDSFLTRSMHDVPQMEMNGEVAVATFAFQSVDWLPLDGRQAGDSPFHYARYVRSFRPIEPTIGVTPMDMAVLAGLQVIEDRKRALAAAGYVHESRPVMFLVTDGESSNDMTRALSALRQAEAAKKVLFFALGVGDANDEEMRRIAPDSYYSMKDQPIDACLRFVSGSLGVLAGIDDAPTIMYSAVRSANTSANSTAESFLKGG